MTENWTELSSGAACQEGRGHPQPGCIHTALPSIPLTPSPIRVQRNYLYICINVYLVTLALAPGPALPTQPSLLPLHCVHNV